VITLIVDNDPDVAGGDADDDGDDGVYIGNGTRTHTIAILLPTVNIWVRTRIPFGFNMSYIMEMRSIWLMLNYLWRTMGTCTILLCMVWRVAVDNAHGYIRMMSNVICMS